MHSPSIAFRHLLLKEGCRKPVLGVCEPCCLLGLPRDKFCPLRLESLCEFYTSFNGDNFFFFFFFGLGSHLPWSRNCSEIMPHFQCMHFVVSIVHRTLTWTTISLMCVCDLFPCVYTRSTVLSKLNRYANERRVNRLGINEY